MTSISIPISRLFQTGFPLPARCPDLPTRWGGESAHYHPVVAAVVVPERRRSAPELALRQFGARLFEAAPGLVTWVLLLAPAWIPIVFPWPGAFAVAGAVLIFDFYWLIRSVTVMRGVYGTYQHMQRDMSTD